MVVWQQLPGASNIVLILGPISLKQGSINIKWNELLLNFFNGNFFEFFKINHSSFSHFVYIFFLNKVSKNQWFNRKVSAFIFI